MIFVFAKTASSSARAVRRIAAKKASLYEEHLNRAATILRSYITTDLGVSVRTFARAYKAMGLIVPESTLRHFLCRCRQPAVNQEDLTNES
jgi:hypothetical protein